MQRMDADTTLARVYAPCPADVFRQEMPLLSRLLPEPRIKENEVCEGEPADCLAACVDRSDAASCFGLARTFQQNENRVAPRYAQMLFSMACALGRRGGCTNRAASIRNRNYPGDPFAEAPDAAKAVCEFRSFTTSCGPGDPWGCAMLGQAYELGEGTARDAGEARRLYRRTCDAAPTFAACDFARDRLKEMDGAAQ